MTTKRLLENLVINYIKHIFESKKEFHRNNASLPYEEKVKQIVELQKIDIEFGKYRKEERPLYKRKAWVLDY